VTVITKNILMIFSAGSKYFYSLFCIIESE
jgi:hypothetical protein